jgi:type II secretory pathway pseudopilin PulG
MAVVMVIVALLIGGMLLPMGAQRELRLAAESRQQLEEIREALIGYAIINGRLPCPDTDFDGLENGTPGNCTNVDAYLPYANLGLQRSDPYGWLFRYRVSNNFTDTFTVTSVGDISIATRGDDPATTPTIESKFASTLATNAPAVTWSVGKNGRGGVSLDTGSSGAAIVSGTDEAMNNSGSTKITRIASTSAQSCSDTSEGVSFCEFDDILVWLPASILISRLVSAGKLSE